LGQESATKANYAGGDGAGASWTDKIMDVKGTIALCSYIPINDLCTTTPVEMELGPPGQTRSWMLKVQ